MSAPLSLELHELAAAIHLTVKVLVAAPSEGLVDMELLCYAASTVLSTKFEPQSGRDELMIAAMHALNVVLSDESGGLNESRAEADEGCGLLQAEAAERKMLH